MEFFECGCELPLFDLARLNGETNQGRGDLSDLWLPSRLLSGLTHPVIEEDAGCR